MQKSIVVVDMMQDSAESVVDALTGCFANAANGMPELGLGSAEYDVVLNAWKMYMVLVANAAKMRIWADRLFMVSSFLVLIVSLASVLDGVLPNSPDNPDDEVTHTVLGTAIIVI